MSSTVSQTDVINYQSSRRHHLSIKQMPSPINQTDIIRIHSGNRWSLKYAFNSNK